MKKIATMVTALVFAMGIGLFAQGATTTAPAAKENKTQQTTQTEQKQKPKAKKAKKAKTAEEKKAAETKKSEAPAK